MEEAYHQPDLGYIQPVINAIDPKSMGKLLNGVRILIDYLSGKRVDPKRGIDKIYTASNAADMHALLDWLGIQKNDLIIWLKPGCTLEYVEAQYALLSSAV